MKHTTSLLLDLVRYNSRQPKKRKKEAFRLSEAGTSEPRAFQLKILTHFRRPADFRDASRIGGARPLPGPKTAAREVTNTPFLRAYLCMLFPLHLYINILPNSIFH